MSAAGGTRAVVAALLANLGIAATKFLAFFLTRSSSMLAEGGRPLSQASSSAVSCSDNHSSGSRSAFPRMIKRKVTGLSTSGRKLSP